jgi:hypothetical protein
MQDRARPHTANVVLAFLHDTFDSRIISNRFPDRIACGQNWPPNSPDLNTCDYFLWGFLKKKIFLKKPRIIMELRALIIQACKEITEDARCRVINITEVKKLPDIMVVVLKLDSKRIDKSPCYGISFCILVSNIVIEIKLC